MGKATSAIAVLAVLTVGSVARAQPGQPPQPPPPAGWGQPQPVPQPQLTPAEQRLLQQGEYSDGQIIGSGLLGTFFGFGTGHAVQGRFAQRGWIFLVGEAVAGYFWLFTLVECLEDSLEGDDPDNCNGSALVGSMLALGVLRIWEIVDVWSYPGSHNRKVRRLRNRMYQQQGPYPAQPRWGFFAAPSKNGGGVAGVAIRF